MIFCKNQQTFSNFNETFESFESRERCKPEKREPCTLSVFNLHYRGIFSAATFCAEVLGSELLLTGFFWSSFLGVVLARFFSPRAFRLWIPKRCKGVHCVDLGESFPTSIYLQNLASIQPRTAAAENEPPKV